MSFTQGRLLGYLLGPFLLQVNMASGPVESKLKVSPNDDVLAFNGIFLLVYRDSMREYRDKFLANNNTCIRPNPEPNWVPMIKKWKAPNPFCSLVYSKDSVKFDFPNAWEGDMIILASTNPNDCPGAPMTVGVLNWSSYSSALVTQLGKINCWIDFAWV